MYGTPTCRDHFGAFGWSGHDSLGRQCRSHVFELHNPRSRNRCGLRPYAPQQHGAVAVPGGVKPVRYSRIA
jgi:hypothetical protein